MPRDGFRLHRRTWRVACLFVRFSGLPHVRPPDIQRVAAPITLANAGPEPQHRRPSFQAPADIDSREALARRKSAQALCQFMADAGAGCKHSAELGRAASAGALGAWFEGLVKALARQFEAKSLRNIKSQLMRWVKYAETVGLSKSQTWAPES